MIASGLPTFKKIVCWNYFLNFTLRRLLIFLIFKLVLGAHVRHRAFATLQNELYRVVDYDSKWSTKVYEDCMLELFLNFTFKTSFGIFFNFQNSIRAHGRAQNFCNSPN